MGSDDIDKLSYSRPSMWQTLSQQNHLGLLSYTHVTSDTLRFNSKPSPSKWPVDKKTQGTFTSWHKREITGFRDT